MAGCCQFDPNQKPWLAQLQASAQAEGGNALIRHVLERDDLSSNRHPALHYWWSMIRIMP
jgi:hypothetical protein